jgi:uncharacterized UBP type Zn finger protein
MLKNNYKGFYNIGNSCYLNSALQLIINNKDLCNEIIKTENKLSDFVKSYYNEDDDSLSPEPIKNIISRINKDFNNCKQHDAFEFIIYLLEYIYSITKTNMYELENNQRIKCKRKACLNINNNIEKSNFLLLDTNGETLDECYINLKKSEKLFENNAYYCNICKMDTIASKRTSINKWPKHLIIVLKRFTSDGRNKETKPIKCDIDFRHGYKLKGIIFHSGSLHGGHYIYIGFHNNKWILFNDNFTKELNECELERYKNNGYIYYYSL